MLIYSRKKAFSLTPINVTSGNKLNNVSKLHLFHGAQSARYTDFIIEFLDSDMRMFIILGGFATPPTLLGAYTQRTN